MGKFYNKKSWGQNFLKDSNIQKKIVDSAGIDDNTLVIEVGPGQGAITRLIVPKAKYSILYEIDDRLEWFLSSILNGYNNYKLITGDFLLANVNDEIKKYDYDKLYVVSNLPYYITTPIICKFIDDKIFPDRVVVMLQKEVADRLTAKVGCKEYGAITVKLGYYYDIKKLFDVSKKAFYPVPKVDSAVICMDLKKNRLDVKDMFVFNKVVMDSFKYKRKNIKNNLKDYDLDKVSDVLERYGLDLSVRAEDISIDVFVDIANEIG